MYCYNYVCLYHISISTQFNLSKDMPTDAQRVQLVKLLVNAGYSNRVLLAHDIHTKHRLVCTYIPLCLIPYQYDIPVRVQLP